MVLMIVLIYVCRELIIESEEVVCNVLIYPLVVN